MRLPEVGGNGRMRQSTIGPGSAVYRGREAVMVNEENPNWSPPASDVPGQTAPFDADSGRVRGIVVKAKFLAVPPGTLDKQRMEIEIPPGTTVGELISLLAEEYPVLRSYTRFVSAAVNRAYVGMQTELHDGDEVIYSPPVGGG